MCEFLVCNPALVVHPADLPQWKDELNKAQSGSDEGVERWRRNGLQTATVAAAAAGASASAAGSAAAAAPADWPAGCAPMRYAELGRESLGANATKVHKEIPAVSSLKYFPAVDPEVNRSTGEGQRARERRQLGPHRGGGLPGEGLQGRAAEITR